MERRPRLDGGFAWRCGSVAEVRDRIARTALGSLSAEAELGSVTLHPHQASAVQRLEAAIAQFDGALLCDEVGMGKTYVALAIARKHGACLVVSPASLISMWRSALAATRVDAAILTFESLSRADVDNRGTQSKRLAVYDLVVVDEAHHARNPRTNRYFALESLVRGARVLLLSATPIHNRRGDLVALLSLFLGSRARTMTESELALCVVRREQSQLKHAIRIPRVLPVIQHHVPDDPPLVRQLMSLPPPVPPRDGGFGGSLVTRGLVHQWASSEAALREAVKRRIARALALCASLEAGTYPTSRELETWIYGEGVLQLGFAELLSSPSASPLPAPSHHELLSAMRRHLAALEILRSAVPAIDKVDSERARIVSAIKQENPTTKIVAFAQYGETISMLFRRLARTGALAMLTSHGARVAGGPLTRTEAIERFSPDATGAKRPARAEVIDVLLTTDLLSEGVNLQDAQTVIHLDIPWTAARMEQRVGRVARLGSRHDYVVVHALRPPRSAADLIAAETIVERKWRVANRAVGTSDRGPVVAPITSTNDSEPGLMTSPPAKVENLRAILESWLLHGRARVDSVAKNADSAADNADSVAHNADTARGDVDAALVATLVSPAPGFVAAISRHGAPELLIGLDDRITLDIAAQIERCEKTDGLECETVAANIAAVLAAIQDWCSKQTAAATAGLGASTALRRREITNRIDSLIESAPPHLRAARLASASRARGVTTRPQCAAVERELEALQKSDLPADAWLAAVADLDARQAADHARNSPGDDFRVHAILILGVKPRRSRRRRGQESP